MQGSLQGASRGSATESRRALTGLLSGDVDGHVVADELFGVVGLLDHHGSLRRALTDPSREGEVKASLVSRVLGPQLSAPVTDLVSGVVRHRWARTRDLADTLEELAVLALLDAAQRQDRLEALEIDLFRFGRTIAGDRGLSEALGRTPGDADRRGALVDRLLGDRTGPEAARLARQAGARPRGRTTVAVLEQYGDLAADFRRRLVGRVTAAVPLTEQQRDRLGAVLNRWYGREVQLDVEVDPDVLGGMRIQVGDEVVDSTVLARLDSARRGLAS